MSKDCTCESCVRACSFHTGMFAPGEAERAAEHLGMTFEDFRAKYLVMLEDYDNWDGVTTYSYRPRRPGVDKGVDYEDCSDGGKCIFLDTNDRCEIHAVKPMECRISMCCSPRNSADDNFEKVRQLWRDAGNPLEDVEWKEVAV